MANEALTSEQSQSLAQAVPKNVRQALTKKPRYFEGTIAGFLFFCGFVSIFTTLGIVYVLGTESLLFFGYKFDLADVSLTTSQACNDNGDCETVTLTEFLGTTTWQPQELNFGVLPLVLSTIITSTLAMLVALPLGLGSAIYLSEYASSRVRSIIKPILEVLAGIPTVVYGYFALTFMTPLLRSILGQDTVEIFNMAAAGLVMGIMILPLVASLSEDALSAVPNALREAGAGLGSTKFETTTKVIVPAALSGIVAAFIIAISRAVGETMIMAIAAGSGPDFTFNPLNGAETMTGHIARISGGDISYDSIDYNSLFAIGLLLFLMTFSLNILSRRIVARFREVYE